MFKFLKSKFPWFYTVYDVEFVFSSGYSTVIKGFDNLKYETDVDTGKISMLKWWHPVKDRKLMQICVSNIDMMFVTPRRKFGIKT